MAQDVPRPPTPQEMYPLLTAYLTAFRNLPTLLVPWLLATVPLGLAAFLTLPIVASESISIVNGRLTLIGPPGTPLLIWAAVLLALWLVAMTLASAAAATLAAPRRLWTVRAAFSSPPTTRSVAR